MFAGAVAAPALAALLIRYYLVTEAIKFATGTERKDWIKMSLDISEQIGNIAIARFEQEIADPRPLRMPTPLHPSVPSGGDLALDLLATGSALFGIPGTAAEALGYKFPGAAAKQRRRLESEVTGGFPFTKERLRGAPKFAKRKVSSWNRDVKKGYAIAKANKNEFGMKGKINVPKKAFPKIVKIVAAVRKGKKQKSKAGKQIAKGIKKTVSETVKRIRRKYR